MRRFAVAFLLSLALQLPGAGSATARPDEFGSGHDAITLEESLELDIRSVNEARVRYLLRTHVLTQRGAEENYSASVGYGPSTSIEGIQGTVILPTGKRLRTTRRDVIDAPDLADFELYSDSRRQHLFFPGVVPGAIVEFSYQKIVRNLVYLNQLFLLQDDLPSRLRTLTVREPADVPLWLSATEGAAEYTREVKDGVTTHRWRVSDVEPFHAEPDGPPVIDMLPYVAIRSQVIDWGGRRIDASSWDGIAGFFRGIAESRMQPPPEVSQAAARIASGAESDAGKIRKVYEFLQDKVDYVAIELGIGGWQPHPSGQVLRYGYGDCKDKAVLMIAMLRSLNVQALPVLIRTRDSGLVQPEHPSFNFNHAIVAIPNDKGYQFIDPTSTTTPFGDIPWTDQGASALVVGQDGSGKLVTTPVSLPERNERRFGIDASIDDSGALHANVELVVSGQRLGPLAPLRAVSKAEREARIGELFGSLVPGGQLKSHEIDAAAVRDGVMRVNMAFSIPRYVTSAGALEVIGTHVIRFPGLASMAAAQQRTQAIFFPYPFTETVDMKLQLPVGMTAKRMPQNRKIELEGFSTETSYELSRENGRNTLFVRRSISVGRREVPAAEYAAWRTFVTSIAEEDARAITLQPQ